MLKITSYEIKSLGDLEKLAEKILPFLQPNIYLLLQGELGVGKTTFTQIIAKKLGISEPVNSPTFTILQQYSTQEDYKLNHFDFFRLSPQDNLVAFQELTIDNLNIIEWPEKNPQFWQKEKYLYLTFSFEKKIRMAKLNYSR